MESTRSSSSVGARHGHCDVSPQTTMVKCPTSPSGPRPFRPDATPRPADGTRIRSTRRASATGTAGSGPATPDHTRASRQPPPQAARRATPRPARRPRPVRRPIYEAFAAYFQAVVEAAQAGAAAPPVMDPNQLVPVRAQVILTALSVGPGLGY